MRVERAGAGAAGPDLAADRRARAVAPVPLSPPTRRSSGSSSSPPGAPSTWRCWRRPQALGAQRRAAEAESAAQAAQVRALRYQVNPHFLFNTLNSLSSLVMAGRPDRAETMLLSSRPSSAPACRSIRPPTSPWPRRSTSSASTSTSRRCASPTACKVEIDVPEELEQRAASGADPPADRRECDQIWRVADAARRWCCGSTRAKPGHGRFTHRDQQSAASTAGKTTCRDGNATKAPASAWPTSASGSRRASATRANCALGPTDRRRLSVCC